LIKHVDLVSIRSLTSTDEYLQKKIVDNELTGWDASLNDFLEITLLSDAMLIKIQILPGSNVASFSIKALRADNKYETYRVSTNLQ
jgi:hypothetical protein